MRIKSIRALNIKTFSDFSMECADVNVCSGMNAGGKSSALTLVTALFGTLGQKGDPNILRAGADRGEISATIENDDRTETWEVTRVFLPGKIETPRVVSSISGKIGSPVSWLAPLIDKVSLDPLSRAMSATPEEQTQILLETLPMAVDQKELDAAAAGVDVPGIKAHLQNASRLASGLDAINNVHTAIYDHRRDTNRDAKAKTINANELLSTIPDGREGTNWKVRAEELQSALYSERNAETSEKTALDRDATERRTQLQTWQAEQDLIVDRDIDARIKELEQERASRKSEVARILADNMAEVNQVEQTQKEEIGTAHRVEIERLTGLLAEAKHNAEDQITHERSRQLSRKAQDESATLAAKSDAMTAALDRLDALRTSMLGRLDKEIRGLSLEKGIIYINGVPLSQLNTAEQSKFWIRIGARRASELGVVCIDGMECFDQKHFDAVVQSALGTGLQWFMGRVDDHPFRVEKYDAALGEIA